MLRQSTRERARFLGGTGRADRRGSTMAGVIDGRRGWVVRGDYVARSLNWKAADEKRSSGRLFTLVP